MQKSHSNPIGVSPTPCEPGSHPHPPLFPPRSSGGGAGPLRSGWQLWDRLAEACVASPHSMGEWRVRLPDGVRKVDCWGGSKAIMVMRAGHLETAPPRTAHPPHAGAAAISCPRGEGMLFEDSGGSNHGAAAAGWGGGGGQPAAGLPPPPTRHRQRRVEEDGTPTAWQHRV